MYFKFPPDKYGRTVNLRDHTMKTERDEYCRSIGESPNFPLSDAQHDEFEIAMSKKYRKEFTQYLKSIGGLEIGVKTVEAQNRKSTLLNHYIERRRRNERKAAIPVRHGTPRSNGVA